MIKTCLSILYNVILKGKSRKNSSSLAPQLIAIAKSIAIMVLNRTRLAMLEISEMKPRLLKLTFLCVLAVVSLWFALGFWSITLLVLAWKILGWKVLPIFALSFTILLAYAVFAIRRMIQQGCFSLPTTTDELRKDRDSLL